MKSYVYAAALGLAIIGAAPSIAQDQNYQPENPRQGGGMRRGDTVRSGDQYQNDRGPRDPGRVDNWRDQAGGDRADRGHQGDYRDAGRHDRGHHYGGRNHRHCTWVWRHHHRERRCR